MSSLYDTIRQELDRYKPEWYEEMHVTAIATWLSSWHDDIDLYKLYVESLAERRHAYTLWDLARAVKINRAAYVALDPVNAKQLAVDKQLRELVDFVVQRIGEEKAAKRQEAARLADVLKALLPRYPYNT